EGPTYDPATGTLYWFDIVGRKLFEKRLPDGEVIAHDLPEMTSALAVIDDERQLLVTETGLYIRDKATGRITLHKAVEADNPVTRSNDSRVHPCGALWFSTMNRDGEGAIAGSIYHYRRGEVRRLYSAVGIPNSICFAPDGATAYFTDTRKNVLMRVDCDPATGLPVGDPATLVDTSAESGGFDGSVMDRDGVLWNARWGSGRVDAYAPDGRRLRSLPVPASQASCPVFVGKHAQHMAVTSAWQGLDAAERAADPHAGQTFLLDGAFNGRFDPPVDL
ncbi:SMP-30/gluconolactonase/LRE family protein, partial [Escherichia coli]|nr:SMP-30/gluconolactonase/LRE family protein [Escherichia coli]